MKSVIKLIKELVFSKVSQNSFWLLILQGFNTIIPFLTLPYITRILSTSTYGEFTIALNLIGYFQVIVEYGFGLTGARRVATHKSKEELNRIHSSIVCARLTLLVLCILIFSIVILIANFEQTQLICMIILLLMVVAIAFQQNWFFQGIAEMKNIALISVVGRLASVILTFLFVKTPDDLYLYCFLYVSNYLISSLIGCIVVRAKYRVKFIIPRLFQIKNEIIDGWSLFVSSAMTKIFGSIGITVLGIVSTTENVGVYSAINKIPYVLTLLFSAISQAIYPFICKAFEVSFENGLKKVRKYAGPVFLAFLLGGFAIISAHKQIVGIIFGADYVTSSTLLIPFVLWVLCGIANNFFGVQTLVASGHQKEYSVAFTISVVVMLCLMLSLGKFFGAYGIAYASMISEMVLSGALLFFIRKAKKAVL